MNFSTQSSLTWYSGSVSKSHTVGNRSPAQRHAGISDISSWSLPIVDAAFLGPFRGHCGVDDHGVQPVPVVAVEARAQQQAVRAAAGSRLAPAADCQRGQQPQGKLINQPQE